MSDDSPQTTTPTPRRSGKLITAGLLLLILALATGFRLYRIGSQSLWVDELMTLEITGGRGWVDRSLPRGELLLTTPDPTSLNNAAPWWDVVPGMAAESHPPLYFVLLRGWREVFDSSETALRMLSVIFSVAAVLLMYEFGQLVAGRTVGLWSAAIMAVAGPQIIYAQETRSYTLLLLTMLWGAVVLLRIERDGLTLRRGLFFALSMLAMIFTHYFAIAPLAAFAIYVLLRFRGHLRMRTMRVMISTGLFFLIIWTPMLIRQAHAIGINNRWLTERGPDHLQKTLDRLAILPLRLVAEPLGKSMDSAKVSAIAYLIFPLLLIRRRELLLPVLMAATTILLLTALDLTRSTMHLQWVRYSLPASAGAYCLLAAVLSDRKALRHLVPICIVLYAVVSMKDETYKPWKENWREVTQRIDMDHSPLVIHSPTGDLWENIMFLGVKHYSTQQRPIAILTTPASPELMEKLRPYHDLWLLSGWKTPLVTETLPGCHVENSWRIDGIGNLIRVRLD